MSFRLVTVAMVLVLGGAMSAASAAESTASRTAAERATARTQLHFTFDHGESLRPGTRVRNHVRRSHGRVMVAEGGRLERVKGVSGRAVKFPGACGRCGYAVIDVKDRRALDPRRRGFRFGATVRMTPRQGGHRMNVVQKGYHRQPGGQYKLQVDFGRPSCVVGGSAGRVIVRSNANVANRRWHTVTCQRVGPSVVLRVDGTVRGRASGPMGRVANASVVRIGAKKLGPGRVDQYHGRLDNVFLRINRTR